MKQHLETPHTKSHRIIKRTSSIHVLVPLFWPSLKLDPNFRKCIRQKLHHTPVNTIGTDVDISKAWCDEFSNAGKLRKR